MTTNNENAPEIQPIPWRRPRNRGLPAPLGERFSPGPLKDARVVAKFQDRREVKYGHLSTGTVVRAEEKVESKSRRHRNEVANRAPNLRRVRFTINPAAMLAAVAAV